MRKSVLLAQGAGLDGNGRNGLSGRDGPRDGDDAMASTLAWRKHA
ncbi:hypothetical protein H4684_003110 [Desulfomicrobium macestii]|uniref:Uncharacterized protein n=1 Tax=Desulfomicrobium macestii TaxID=90731 RepID=A0ABR9H6V8_9BACT|nr:hypothetical protein [Desulfomicrobium macestii]MBE1426445.1 hypothetical protein [Desulfomicrobium macestii]